MAAKDSVYHIEYWRMKAGSPITPQTSGSKVVEVLQCQMEWDKGVPSWVVVVLMETQP